MHLQVPDCCGCCLVSVPVSQTLSLQPNSPPISSTAWSRLSESLSLCIPPSLSLCVCLLIFFCHLFSSNVCQSSYLRACARYGARRPKRIIYVYTCVHHVCMHIASSARGSDSAAREWNGTPRTMRVCARQTLPTHRILSVEK